MTFQSLRLRPWKSASLVLCFAVSPGIVAGHAAADASFDEPTQAPETDARAAEHEPQAAAPKPERARRWLFHTADGRVLRSVARPNLTDPSSFELKQGKEWKPLPAALIERAVLEKDVLDQAQVLCKEARRGEPSRRAACAEWMLTQGLVPEALEELDLLLKSHPDDAAALTVLRSGRFQLALPELPSNLEGREPLGQLDGFLAASALCGPAARECAIVRLDRFGAETGDAELQQALAARLEDRNPERRAFVAHALRRLYPGSGVQPLLRRAVLDPSENVRRNAALALKDVGNEAVILPVVKALSSKQGTVREHAAFALGVMNYRAAVEPLIGRLTALQSGSSERLPHSHIFVGRQFAYVQDFDVEVAQGAAIADPVTNVLTEGSVLDVAVHGTSQISFVTEAAQLRRALSNLTGAQPGNTNQAWLQWWQTHGDEWRAKSTSDDPSAPRTPGK